MVTLSDGKNHTLFQFRDFLDLVDDKMGIDARKWLEAHVSGLEEMADRTVLEVDTDLSSYEASLDSNRSAFEEIEEICRSMFSDFYTETGRNRLAALRPWRDKVEKIVKIIGNQL